jgi:hypothetical protein
MTATSYQNALDFRSGEGVTGIRQPDAANERSGCISDEISVKRILAELGLSPPEEEKPPPIGEVVRVPVDDDGRRSRPAEDGHLRS